MSIDNARGNDRTPHVDGTAPSAREAPDGVVIA